MSRRQADSVRAVTALLAMLRRREECLRLDFGVYSLVRALCLHATRRQQEAAGIAVTAEAALTSSGNPDADYLDDLLVQDMAAYHAWAEHAADATRWLRRSFELSPTGVDTKLLQSELFDAVRDDPDFASAVIETREQAISRIQAERARLRG
ncbi:MAG TPA: hypothetical protein EYQ27_20175 [Gemmatimonadetes bacterium]|nr:hypothetical protein [Gemmatimonadota bacterium]